MKKVFVLFAITLLSGCATYRTAEKVKLISFDDNPVKGKSIGNIRGEDCTWRLFNYQLGGVPSVDRAFSNARKGIEGGLAAAGFDNSDKGSLGLKYINNVTTENDGFDAVIFGKTCIVVTGVGYR